MVCCTNIIGSEFAFPPDDRQVICPWGFYLTHYTPEDKSVCFKTLVIECGFQLSLQYHNHRAEFWYIHDENSVYELTLGNTKSIFRGTQTVQIPCGTHHTILNMSSVPLVIYEMQYASGPTGKCENSGIFRTLGLVTFQRSRYSESTRH